ncbi:transcriptional regulator, LuxR family [Beutenbergia cavernae DSM 12333]|uniref:Transcriptional regulator, LuxR family n=1 Tax=Beutenbergia cavernae (strain ATCC BAA-8 / DSM 12333 / CCUG 43141 / JCM 11478 / NBRC 16432 / NCIMB 13614 / HKI 0122) TaxID=471853 RepID=C5BXQ9_BEUC1|nr:LuxR family transcriptional regulator [Beutenbergia cavernae]ACQ80942.1 transcriptional regulator, LuxR family [Beutenbergia cavernae DSM 12333]
MLLGREDDQRAIDALIAAARLGSGGALVVTGDAGIGKSALLDDAVARAEGFQVLRVTGTEAERDLPFAGLAELLRPVTDRIEDLPHPQATALATALALRDGDEVDRFAVSAGVLTLVASLAERRPVLGVVDDALLLDRPSAEAIAFTCRRLLADAVLVLVAVRDPDAAPWSSATPHRRTLAPLAPDAAELLAEAAAPAGLDPHQRRLVLELAEGNPLAVRELVRDPGRLIGPVPDAPPLVPQVLAEAFGERLSRLAPQDVAVLLAAAVAAGDLAVVARACAADALDLHALERAEHLGLLTVTSARVAFSHPLVRSAVYAAASTEDRRRTHRIVADVLPAGDADRRAWHRSAAALGPDAAVADEVEAVGRRAARRGAHAVAATAHERAAHLSTSETVRARRFLAAGDAAASAGEDANALVLLDQALRHDPSPHVAARARLVEGTAAARGGHLRDARDVLTAGGAEAADAAPGLALRMYAEAVDACLYLLDVPGAVRAADAIERLLAAGETDDDASAVAVASVAVGMARILAGGGGIAPIRRGVQLLATLPTRDVPPGWDVIGSLFLRESGAARSLVADALEQGRAAGAVGTLPHLLHHVARDDATTDRWQQAAAGYGEAISLAREFGQVTELAASLAGLAWVMARQGRTAECLAAVDQARQLDAADDVRMGEAWIRFAVAELHLGAGEVTTAIEEFAGVTAWLEDLGVADVDLSPVPELVEALCRGGRSDEALPFAVPYLEQAERKGQPWSLARAARVRGLLAPVDDVDGPFAQALELHAGTLDVFEVARTHLVYGERLRRARRSVDARVHLREALETFHRLGAAAWADIATAELNATGLSVRRREAGPVTELTPRELQIALLLADGRTTREAAGALFLSPKTVEYHLRHVYTKLGIGSRRELAAALRESP